MNISLSDEKKLVDELNKAVNKIADYFDGSYSTSIGIIGSKNTRPAEGDIDNAGLGLVHEFGSIIRNIPPRSWLRMPITNNVEKILKDVRSQKNKIEKGVVQNDDPKFLYNVLGQSADAQIQEAFDSAGFGTWQQKQSATTDTGNFLDPSDSENPSPLIDTGEFRQSIIYKVVKE